MITTATIQDYAQNLMRKDARQCIVAGDFDEFYKGKGNLCLQVILAFEKAGIYDKDIRLAAMADTFEMESLSSSKALTVGQLRALLQYRESFGSIYANLIE